MTSETIDSPVLKRNDYSYDEWMHTISFGKTPDGKKLTRVHFVDGDSDKDHGRFVQDFEEEEIVGEATFLGYQMVGEVRFGGYICLSPGSILVNPGRGSLGTWTERSGECVIYIHPRVE